MAITANKLLGKGESGGALAVRPTTSLVSYKGIDPIEKSESDSSEKTLFTIHKKIILIDDLLKGTIAEKKKRQKDEKKQKEDEQRKKVESKMEDDATDSDDEEENKLKMPRLSFLDGIKKFISNVLLGWLTFKLIKYLPTITKFLKPIAAIAGFFIKWGGKFLDGLVTFIDWGYKGLDATKGWIGDKFGEGAAEKFESFMGNLTKMFNGIVLLGMGIAKLANMGKPKIKQPKRSIKNKIKRQKKLFKRLFDPKRADKLARVKNLKKIKADRLLRVKKFGRLRKFAKAKQFVGKGIDLGKNIVKTGGKVAQTVTKGVKTAVKTATPVIKSAAKTATKLGKTGLKTATKVASTATKGITTAAKTATPVIKSAAKTATTTATKLGKTGLKTGLKGLKAAKKIISPIVKRIPFIGALVDFALNYFVFKEPLGKSAFMAIGAGVGAWLGGILGTLIPVPFVGTTIGAFVGGVGGDKLAGALYGAIFEKKEPKEPKEDKKDDKKKTTKIERNINLLPSKEGYYSMLKSGKRGKIEQALYNMRLNAKQGDGSGFNDFVGNPKYEGDVNLIMKHGLGKVEIDGGRVSIQDNVDINSKETPAAIKGNAENIIPLDVNSIKKKTDDVSMSASYEDDSGEIIVVESGSQGDSIPETQPKETLTPIAVGAGGGSDEMGDRLYKGG